MVLWSSRLNPGFAISHLCSGGKKANYSCWALASLWVKRLRWMICNDLFSSKIKTFYEHIQPKAIKRYTWVSKFFKPVNFKKGPYLYYLTPKLLKDWDFWNLPQNKSYLYLWRIPSSSFFPCLCCHLTGVVEQTVFKPRVFVGDMERKIKWWKGYSFKLKSLL